MTKREKQLESALRALIQKYVSNRGTDGEFIACITPNGIPPYWARAIKLLDKEPPR